MVLLKEIEVEGDGTGAFVIYTNYESAKGREIEAAGKAAFVLHWKSLHRQIRVRGTTEREEGPKADAYYASRSVTSRLGAWASAQSRPLSSRGALMAEVAKQTALHGSAPNRPPHWGGIRIRPVEIEFWADGQFRLHDRFRWTRDENDRWQTRRLNP
jgi:pyridoxamine 5'-phosphate oxidase